MSTTTSSTTLEPRTEASVATTQSIRIPVSGMTCAACSARIRAGDDPAVNAAIEAVRDAGYDAEVAARS